MSEQTGKLAKGGMLEHPHLCDVCGLARNRGKHGECSRVRQARYRSLRETETVQHEAKANA